MLVKKREGRDGRRKNGKNGKIEFIGGFDLETKESIASALESLENQLEALTGYTLAINVNPILQQK